MERRTRFLSPPCEGGFGGVGTHASETVNDIDSSRNRVQTSFDAGKTRLKTLQLIAPALFIFDEGCRNMIGQSR